MRLRIKENFNDIDIVDDNELVFWLTSNGEMHILTYCHPLSRIFDILIYNRVLQSNCSTEIKIRLILGLVLL